MKVTRLWLQDFRNYETAELEPAPDGLTVVIGANGEGKTNLLEAVGYLATLSSFRGAPAEALVRTGAAHAIVRAEAEREGRRLLLEAELHPTGRDRVQVNRQPLRRARDLLGALRVSVFSPDDLALIKGSPGERRRYLDAALVALHPRYDELQGDVDRILKQRNTLLKQAASRGERAGRLSPDIASTLDVWDAKLAAKGEELAASREGLVSRLSPRVGASYDAVASRSAGVALRYARSWDGELSVALEKGRDDDLRRAVSLIGPHRDELEVGLAGLPARTHASQGEQRSLALALRLAAHGVVADEVSDPPVLLLDDVFSELDAERSAALVAALPECQAMLTTAGVVPDAARAALMVRIERGRLVA